MIVYVEGKKNKLEIKEGQNRIFLVFPFPSPGSYLSLTVSFPSMPLKHKFQNLLFVSSDALEALPSFMLLFAHWCSLAVLLYKHPLLDVEEAH